MTLADEIRAECARIIKRNFGIDRAMGAVHISTVEKIDAYVAGAEDRLSRCTCVQDDGFQIDTSRDAPPYRILEELRVERIEARGSMDAVDAAIAAQRKAGLREPVAAIVGGA